MIEVRTLEQLSTRQQTTLDNIIREYFQHLFLTFLYQEKKSESLLFKGGTALRFVWHSPRFSEDLDFTGSKISVREIESLMESTLVRIENEGVRTDIQESKTTSGGYLYFFRFQTDEYASDIQLEISLRAESKKTGTAALIQSDFLPSYNLVHLDEKHLVGEKINACLTRAKARDFYDLYFILRNRMAFKESFAKDKYLKRKLIETIEKQQIDIKSEIKKFLPTHQRLILKNLKSALLAEIDKSIPI